MACDNWQKVSSSSAWITFHRSAISGVSKGARAGAGRGRRDHRVAPRRKIMINKLALIGVGLIGGSLARALRDAGHVREVIGYGRGLANLQRAVELGVVERVETSLSAAVRDADMVVLATPVGSMADILGVIAPYLAKAAVVTDVGSVKGTIGAAARAALGGKFAGFVPGPPLPGRA